MFLKRCQEVAKCKNFYFKLTKTISYLFFGVVLIPICISSNAFGDDLHRVNSSLIKIEYLNPYARIVSRGPTNFVPNDDVESLPIETTLWTQSIFVEDSAGVLIRVKSDISSWQQREEYARNWNLTSTGLYRGTDNRFRKSYFKAHMLKYLDKRLSGEIKNAKKGSALQRIGQAQKALTPKAEASIAPNIKIKLNAKVIEGTTTLVIENPYVDYQTRVDTKGRVEIKFGKEVKEIKLSSQVRYEVAADRWIAQIDRPINRNLLARLSSTQNDATMAFTKKSDNRLELMFNKSF